MSQSATIQADKQFYAAHPQMRDERGKPLPIDPDDPKQQGFANEWMSYFKQAKASSAPPQPPSSEKKPADTAPKCAHDSDKPCCFNSIEISCGHTTKSDDITAKPREFKLKLPGKPSAKGDKKTYSVTAGFSKADIVTVKLAAGSCAKGVSDGSMAYPYLKSSDGQTNKKLLSLNVVSNDIGMEDNWWRYFFPAAKLVPNVYSCGPVCCENPEKWGVTVEAYPKIEWKVAISYNFGGSSRSMNKAEANPGTDTVVVQGNYKKIKGGPSVNLGYVYNGHPTELTGKFEKYAQTAFKFLHVTKELADNLGGFLKELGNVTFDYSLPNVSIEYVYGMAESERTGKVDHSYKFNFSAKPFFAGSGTTDIVDWVISASTGTFAMAVKKVRDQIAKKGSHVSAKLQLNLSIKGSIDGELEWEKVVDEEGRADGSMTPSVLFKAEAVAEGGVKWEYCKISAVSGVKGGARSKLSYTGLADSDKGGVFVQGQLKWDGLTFYYVAYANASATWREPPEPNEEGPIQKTSGKPFELEGGHASGEEDYPDSTGKMHSWTPPCCGPKYWPKEPGKIHFLGGGKTAGEKPDDADAAE